MNPFIFSPQETEELFEYFETKTVSPSPNEFAQRIGVHRNTLRYWIKSSPEGRTLLGYPLDAIRGRLCLPDLTREQYSELQALETAEAKRRRLEEILAAHTVEETFTPRPEGQPPSEVKAPPEAGVVPLTHKVLKPSVVETDFDRERLECW